MAQVINSGYRETKIENSQEQALKVSSDQLVEKIASKLMGQGLSLDNIAKLTGLSKTEVNKLYRRFS